MQSQVRASAEFKALSLRFSIQKPHVNVRWFALALTCDPWQLLGCSVSPPKTPWNHRKKETLQTALYTMTGGEKERAIYGLDLDFHEKAPVPVPPAHKASP